MRNGNKVPRPVAIAAVFLVLTTAALRAENWPHWRGPRYDGSSKEKNLPADFSKTNNVKWVAKLPGPSAATPIIWGDHVFVSSTDKPAKTLRAMAFDRKTGTQLWSNEIAQGFNRDDRSNLASPSPTTDGKLVYFFYGTGDLVAFDFKGNKIWARNIEKEYGQFAFQWTFSTSPTVVDGKLYIQVLQRNEPVNGRGRKDGPSDSYLLALNAKTGEEIWKHIRPADAILESLEAFTTPIPLISYVDNGRFLQPDGSSTSVDQLPIAEVQLLVAGGDCLTAHDGKTGKELWRWGTYNTTKNSTWRLVPSPVVSGRVALVCSPKAAPIYAIKLGGTGKLDDSAVAWKSEERELSSDVCTPLFYQGRFYVLNGERKTIARVDPQSGKPDWIGELGKPTKIECSPTGADGKIYFQNFRSEVFIVEAGEQFKVQVISMGDENDDQSRSVLTVSQGNVFLRTGSKLYCLGK